MNSKIIVAIKALLIEKLLSKIENLNSETEYKPFFDAIFSKKQIITASVIQSFYTSFGMSIYEQISILIAKDNGFFVERQYELLGEIDSNTESLISEMFDGLTLKKIKPDLNSEVEKIRSSIKKGNPLKDRNSIVDLYMNKDDIDYYFGITTVKPNKEGFQNHKHKLLRWIGLRLSQKPNAKVVVATILPYNPYYPEPYVRFGSAELFDKNQFLVQEQFWDFIGGKDTFNQLIKIFQEVGKELREKIDAIG